MKNEIVITGKNEIAKFNLVERANEILENVYSKNTNIAYKKDIEIYCKYCFEQSLDSTKQNSFFTYLTFLSKEHKYSTIQRKSIAIKNIIENIDKKQLSNFLKGVQRICLNENKGAQGAKAATKDIIIDIVNSFDVNTINGLRNKAMVLLGFYGAFRVSELVNLKFENITFDNTGLTIFLEKSKTDQEGKGQYKYIPYKQANICAVAVLKDYLKQANINTGYVFRQVKKGAKVQNEPLSRQAADSIIKQYNNVFSMHSLRAGFVTSASEAGATIQQIQSQTGHKTAQMILHYTRSNDIKKNNAVNML